MKTADSPATKAALGLFKVMLAPKGQLDFGNALDGFITDFTPSPDQLKLLRKEFEALPVQTLFTVEERAQGSFEYLITKQLLHYFEVYGLGAPGLFELEVSSGRIATLTFVQAVTVDELTKKVQNLIYANRPVADVAPILELLKDLPYDINLVRNNELKVALFDPIRDKFTDGDDAVRYICYQATTSSLLIKSRKVISEVQKNPVGDRFLSNHLLPLAAVFNRHKHLILACKHPATASTINKISKLSKTQHKPIHEALNKRFISEALRGKTPPFKTITLRDAFKYLNLIEYKLLQLSYDSFNIRNGKVWVEANRPALNTNRLVDLKYEVLDYIKSQLSGLKSKKILVDPNVDYGLPISRKQTLGNLPYGTKVSVEDGKLSAGIYWHNRQDAPWGGRSVDLDLSAIDHHGNRTGWGGYAGYAKHNPIVFSGDLTDASKGATEWMVVDSAAPNRYGLMVNIYRGPEPCEASIVVGTPTGKVWQDKTLIKEQVRLESKQSLIGFLKDSSFIVYTGRLNNSRISAGKHPVIDKGLGKLWTIGLLLDACGIPYDDAPGINVTYDFDLRYHSFTLDKLENMLNV